MASRNQVDIPLSGSTGSASFAGSTSPTIATPTLVTPILGTPASGALGACTNFTWGSQGGTGIPIQFASGSLSSTDIQNLVGTPVDIVAAPGAGKLVQMISISTRFFYVAPQYVSVSGFIRLRYNGAPGSTIFNTVVGNGVMTGTANAVSFAPPGPIASADVNNETLAVCLVNSSGVALTTGAGTLSWWIWYMIVDTTI